MCAYKLIHVLWIGKVADLAPCINPVKWLASQSIPKAYTTVSGTTTTAHHAMLMWWPCYSLDGCLMLVKFHKWLTSHLMVPDQQLIIIASRGKLLLVGTPLEATNLLFMSFQFCKEIIFHSEIPMQDALVAGPRTKHVIIPCDTPYSPLMSCVALDHFLSNCIPCLQLTARCAYSELLPIIGPCYACHRCLTS